MKKKVLIYAYTNFNLGDDLFIKLLCERYPNTLFYLYVPSDYKKLFNDIRNIRIIPSDKFYKRAINYFFRLLKVDNVYLRTKLAKKSDALVYIGGSLFMQKEGWEKEFEKKSNFSIKDKPFYLLGANFGPFQDNEYYTAYKKLFSTYTDICFRDSYSYELFKELPNVRMADDIIFQLKTQPKIKEVNTNNVVISVIKPSIREHLVNYDEVYYNKIKDIIISLNEKEFQVTLMSFCEKEGDEEAIEKVLELLPKNYSGNVKKHFYKYNIDKALEEIANSNFVIATRFHSMILGWLYNKPVFPIVYSKKMTNVMEDVGFNGLYIDLKNIEQLETSDVHKSIKTNIIDISKQIENAEGHFKKLDKLLLN